MLVAVLGRWLARGRVRACAGVGTGAALLAASMLLPATAPATGRSQTVRTVIHFPADPLTNLCNGDVVNLNGDLYITTTTTPTSNGGFTVRSSAYAPNLKGVRVAPLPQIAYKGQDAENSFEYVAPPPYPATFTDVHWTKLLPQSNAPTMYLVIVLRETTAADGVTTPTLDRMYLTCTQPKCSATRDD